MSHDVPASRRLLPLLLVLFVGSGCSALIYEIVWFQLLQFVIGSSAVSLAVLLGTFMGGMCLGSLLFPRLVSARRHPLRVYALLELGIGLLGLAILFGMPYVDPLYVANVGHGFSGILLRGAVCAVCLLPPTLLMGATLPAISRWVEASPRDVSWLGFFYGGNIAGAVFGCLLAGFYLLRVHDVPTAAYVAAAINVAVAAAGLALAAVTPQTAPAPQAPAGRKPRAADAWMVYLTIALSGMSALGAEVVWTRLLSLLLGATVYTFSIILAVFLVGLGVGSAFGSVLTRRSARPRLVLGGCQLLLAAAILWADFQMTRSLPYWPVQPDLSPDPWFNFQLDILRCLWAVLPATVLWGASFPLALAAVAARGQDTGRLVGGVYAANTAGAIVGALGSGLVVVAWAGTQAAQQVLIVISAFAALLMFASLLGSSRVPRHAEAPAGRGLGDLAAAGLLAAAAGVLLVSSTGLAALAGLRLPRAWCVPEVPGELVAWGRDLPQRAGQVDVIYVGEGMNASVAVTQAHDGRRFHVSGKVEASTIAADMRLQRMLGHLSALFHAKPRKVLVVGCGAGVTAGTFVRHPDVERIVICDIEPLIPQVVATHFADANHDVLHDPRVEVVHDDARHYVLTTREKFDIITSDPIHPWVKGAATLYTKEYFELCKQHLNPGGLVTQWVPLYESDPATVKSEVATFFDAFPHGTIWGNTAFNRQLQREGYDVVLLGQAEPTVIDLDEFDRRWYGADHAGVAQSLKDVDCRGPVDLLATYAGRAEDLKPWLAGAEINRDRNLRLQYLAGLGLNHQEAGPIYRDMLQYYHFPEDLFAGSEDKRRIMRQALEQMMMELFGLSPPAG
jgi:spermidine synthase